MSKYNERHGGPWDRGSADSYYGRPEVPHYYIGGTGSSEKIEESDMGAEEISAYHAGYDYNESVGDSTRKKDWG